VLKNVAGSKSIKVAEDVTIKGAVGKSTIEAEDNVLIARGFIGEANKVSGLTPQTKEISACNFFFEYRRAQIKN
jgi:uncharacterized protein (DUF342 family)